MQEPSSGAQTLSSNLDTNFSMSSYMKILFNRHIISETKEFWIQINSWKQMLTHKKEKEISENFK